MDDQKSESESTGLARYKGKPVRILGRFPRGVIIGKGDGMFDIIPYSELEFVDGRGVETR